LNFRNSSISRSGTFITDESLFRVRVGRIRDIDDWFCFNDNKNHFKLHSYSASKKNGIPMAQSLPSATDVNLINSASIIDISVPISESLPVWPGDPAIKIRQSAALAHGDPADVSHLDFGSHTGTHVDAFSHFKPDGKTLNQMDLQRYIGRALVVEIEDPNRITLGELQRNPSFLDLRKAERVLFKTVNSDKQWYTQPFNPDFCHLSPHAADFLIELGLRLVGVDAMSVDGFHAKELYGEDVPVHHRLLNAGVYILEGLTLKDVKAGWYDLICLPLALQGDGAPARAVLKSIASA
jgi:arylformamidase